MYERNERRLDEGTAAGRSGPSPALIGAIVLAVLAVVFVVQNQNEARIRFLFWEGRTDVWVAILIALVIGVLLGQVLLMLWKRRRRD